MNPSNTTPRRYSTAGRPRRVTDTQLAAILAWLQHRKTLKQLARELDLPVATIRYVIRIQGHYKKPAP